MPIKLIGIGASPGVAEGKVKWLTKKEDMDTFETGAILLAKLTSPDWGEIFQKAAAVATEQGGMLCHAAIVAREEGIPAVVGLGPTLSDVHDGDIVIVNGDDGTIVRSSTIE